MGFKIAIVGGPSSGKTSLALKVTAALKTQDHNVEHCTEYARTYIGKTGPITSPWEEFPIFYNQEMRENQLCEKYDLVVCDSGGFLPFIYAQHADIADLPRAKFIYLFRKLYRHALESLSEYALVFHLPSVFKVFNDGIRVHNDEQSYNIAAEIHGFLSTHCFLTHVRFLDSDHTRWEEVVTKTILDELLLKKGLTGADICSSL